LADRKPVAPVDEVDIHAGYGETSLMLALIPQWVRPDRLAMPPVALSATSRLSLEGRFAVAWKTSDVAVEGVIGNPAAASPDEGHRRFRAMVENFSALLQEIVRFEGWRPGGVGQ
jgi:creatinine amidohydrolase